MSVNCYNQFYDQMTYVEQRIRNHLSKFFITWYLLYLLCVGTLTYLTSVYYISIVLPETYNSR